MTPEEIVRLAVERYSGEGCEGISACVFALLVDVAETYSARLEEGGEGSIGSLAGMAADEITLAGLAENLAMRHGGN